MGLPSSGSISMAQVRSELSESGSISLGQSSVRSLAERSSGSISMSHLKGKSSWEGDLSDLEDSYVDVRSSGTPLVEIAFLPDGRIRLRKRYTELFIGNWSTSTANSSNTEVKFLGFKGQIGTNNFSNGAENYSQISSTRAFSLSGIESIAKIEVKVYLRKKGVSGFDITKTLALSTSYENFGGGLKPL